MEIYDSEQDQVEALKKWWKENGRSVIAGLVIGLGAVLGWQYWVKHQEKQAITSSISYELLVELVNSDRADEARQQGQRLIEASPRSTYAALSALLLARISLEQDDPAEAKQYLQWVIDHTNLEALKQVARLRLARLLLAEQAFDEALALLPGDTAQSFEAPVEETRGDVLAARGDRDGARTAYSRALLSLPPTSTNRQMLQMKLDDLGPGEPSPIVPAQAASS